jgi:hypothetical protein
VREYFHLILKNSNFIASFVTELPTQVKREQVLSSSVPAPSGLQNVSSPQQRGNSPDRINAIFSPEDVRPFPRAVQETFQIERKRERKRLS